MLHHTCLVQTSDTYVTTLAAFFGQEGAPGGTWVLRNFREELLYVCDILGVGWGSYSLTKEIQRGLFYRLNEDSFLHMHWLGFKSI